jgi:hypothetical protein
MPKKKTTKRKKVTFWATVEKPKRVKVTFYARKKPPRKRSTAKKKRK